MLLARRNKRRSAMLGAFRLSESFLSIGDCWLTELSNILWADTLFYRWQNLADKLGFSRDEIDEFERSSGSINGVNPVYQMFLRWGKMEGATFRVMREKLKELERLDVLMMLEEAIKGEFQLEVQIWTGEGTHDFAVHSSKDSILAEVLATYLKEHNLEQEDIVFISPRNSGFDLDWSTDTLDLKGRELVLATRDFRKLDQLHHLYSSEDDSSSTSSAESSSKPPVQASTTNSLPSSPSPSTPSTVIMKHYFTFEGCNIGTVQGAPNPLLASPQEGGNGILVCADCNRRCSQDSSFSELHMPSKTQARGSSSRRARAQEEECQTIPIVCPSPSSPGGITPERHDEKTTAPLSTEITACRFDDQESLASTYSYLRDDSGCSPAVAEAMSAPLDEWQSSWRPLVDMCVDNPAWHPNLPPDATEIEKVVKPYIRQDGWYLIHPFQGKILITVTFQRKLKHFCLFQEDGGKIYICKDDYKFRTLEDLVEVYRFTDILVVTKSSPRSDTATTDPAAPAVPERRSHIRLRKPIPVDPRLGY